MAAPPVGAPATDRHSRRLRLWYDPFDPEYCRDLLDRTLGPVARQYFRPRLIGAERLPARGPAILAANHSGNAFPYDAIMLDATLWRADEFAVARKVRSLFEPALTESWWMRPFGIDNFWRRGGGVDMTFDNFERLMQRGDRVLYFPEGVPGIGKGFNRRYQLQPFKTSFVVMAARHGAPVYPISIVNGEWIVPFGYTFRFLDGIMQRVFRVPFLPIPIGLLGVVFPFMWYFAFPAHLVFVVGRPIDVRAMMWREGITDFESPPRAAARRVAERIRVLMQQELDAEVALHGRRPFEVASLWKAVVGGTLSFGRVLPPAWTLTMVRQDRDRHRPAPRNRLLGLLRDWDLLFFYVPFGWPLLSLARRLRRPPYGYRGLHPEERRDVQGQFLWRLVDRPLPPHRQP
ncbi:MAG TPA: 1-acyl-sn-glycerol-3-phosphate acyltransferase [Gemmatimonadales bacterium]|nr:1-acyl-sn-glycerol-3-phosphate acyltransferase [Gemmatimonadales bacterium]